MPDAPAWGKADDTWGGGKNKKTRQTSGLDVFREAQRFVKSKQVALTADQMQRRGGN